MKKLLALLMVLMMVFTLTACFGGNGDDDNGNGNENGEEILDTNGNGDENDNDEVTINHELVGTWEVIASDMPELEGNTYEFRADGTGTERAVAGVSTPFTWEVDGDVFYFTTGGMTLEYEFEIEDDMMATLFAGEIGTLYQRID